MMGPRQIDQAVPFYEFSLERTLRRPTCLGPSTALSICQTSEATSRHFTDPELLARMVLVGYCFGIRSERRLRALAYGWLCRLGPDGEVPDQFKNGYGRFRYCDLLLKLFETVVRRCMAERLVDGVAFAVDAG